MAERYHPQEVDKRWRERWAAEGIDTWQPDDPRPKHYALTMLPYPSGYLHPGHVWAMGPSDTRARWMRMQGYNVFFPMGFDAFGLPAENAAIKKGLHPKVSTYHNIERIREQFKTIGMMIDWNQEVVTCDPEYYRWNQWFFLQFYKHDLAYKQFAPVDWCPKDNTTLAREQVKGEDRHCERCGTPVIKKNLDQWLFRITNYADELLNFDSIDWPERIKIMQRNWIGRSEGAEVTFTTAAGEPITVFTTRPDTLWGATFMVLAPEHPLVDSLTTPAQKAAVEAYKLQASRQSEIERQATDKPKTGVWTGGFAVNPVNNARIPIWIADYVLMGYGTGAIMAVPAHDQRDLEFARTHQLQVVVVVQPEGELLDGATMTSAHAGEGMMVNSGPLNGVPAGKEDGQSVRAAIRYLEESGKGKSAVTYRLRDWLISRQRYWGTPIPIVYCAACGTVPVPEDQLPVTLPEDVDFVPTGESPLKLHPTWRHTTCPQCGGPAERDTDTMDTFVDSSWYQYRYLSPHDNEHPFDPQHGAHWLPVDQYTGGAEHAVMHLLYTRFWTKAMRDLGLVNFDEPMLRLRNQGIILGNNNEKMSKSKGNFVDPDPLVERYGADTLRCFLMFIAPWEQGGPWNDRSVEGVSRWLNRAWSLVMLEPEHGHDGQDGATHQMAVRRATHRTIKKVGDDLERFSFNTAVAAMMEYVNDLMRLRDTAAYNTPAWQDAMHSLALVLAPFAPHLAEELWAKLGGSFSVHTQSWPSYDEALLVEEQIELPVQVNGKLRDRILVAATADEATVRA
ncbi:MAG: leucine--tRNA ligase, partial [Herpetosiphonaceae bacterium]|nr:leucine--tRNA ligase [Herpetosiphonaceae bacterium]